MIAALPVTVLIADDDADVRSVLVRLLAGHPGITVVGAAADAVGAAELASETRPDVALVDYQMPGGGEAAVRQILVASPATRVVALSGSLDTEIVLAMLGAGASSYLVKSMGSGEVLAAVLRAARGESILAADVASGVLGEFAAQFERDRNERDDAERLRSRVEQVIERKLLLPVFQPVLELDTDHVIGYEALSRFPTEPAVPPAAWFADAEAVGLRAQLELLAAEMAIGAFQARGGDDSLAVNVSPDTLSGVAELGRGLAGRLMLEVTEHAAIEDYRGITSTLAPLRESGIRLAVDDAGAGFASFRHVLELAPDYVKLDASLTRGINEDPRRRALVRGLVAFADELGIKIVAEGIEASAELATLQHLGVRFGQGLLLAPPRPLTAMS